MRVLFVTHNVPRFAGDAAGSFVLRLAVALQQRGARVDVIAPWAPGLTSTGTIEGVTITRVRYASRESQMTLAYDGTMVEQVRASWSARVALFGLLRSFRRATRAAIANALAAGDPYDVVHCHWWFPSGLALLGALPDAPARVLTMHGSDVRLALRAWPARVLLRRVLAMFSVRTAVSSWLAACAQRASDGLPVTVAPMPVDTARFVSRENAARDGILFVGRLNAQKGIADLLRALTHPSLQQATLDVVGDGPDRHALTLQAERDGVASRIRWHGALAQHELVARYQSAQVVAMPSRDEGLGLVAVEAQLCGTPVVAYDSGGIVDVVKSNAGGTLVPVGDIAALSDAIALLLGNATIAARDGATAGAQMRAQFSPAAVAAQYHAFYERALSSSM